MTRTKMVDSASFQDLLAHRVSRRSVLQAGLALVPLTMTGCALDGPSPKTKSSGLRFTPIAGSTADEVILPPGYTYDVVVRWGESLFDGVPDLDASRLADGVLFEPDAARLQAQQFGQNCDAIHFFPLDARGDRAVLCVNNEFTDDRLMYPGHPGGRGFREGAGNKFVARYPQLVGVSQAACGVSIIELVREQGAWRRVKTSRFARRITANTPIAIGGPARGSELMRTPDDPQGVLALGTFGNCAGGRTPWGTYLTAEENIQDYFGNFSLLEQERGAHDRIVAAHRRWGMHSVYSLYSWEVVDPRFDLLRNPTEPFRHGWIVEIDPTDPQRRPVKRTALGRFAHEGASPIVAHDGRVAVYMGDDAKFEYVYKFVSNGRFNAQRPAANRDLLDDGTLYVARFDANGGGEWLPLVYDERGPLNKAAGFHSQADVLIKARAAASILGATPMDRPEDVDVNPVNGRIYVSCTNNDRRTEGSSSGFVLGREIDLGPNAANPRALNEYGHIIEITETGGDHTSHTFNWEVFLLGGDPRGGKLLASLANVERDSVYFAGYTNADEVSPISSPDNLGFDREGNIWIVTDGRQPDGTNDGCWACPTSGPERGKLRRFMSAPIGSEVCGCQFTPDNETLFIGIQHPGSGSAITDPSSHWPDGGDAPPRASVIAIRKEGGGVVGS